MPMTGILPIAETPELSHIDHLCFSTVFYRRTEEHPPTSRQPSLQARRRKKFGNSTKRHFSPAAFIPSKTDMQVHVQLKAGDARAEPCTHIKALRSRAALHNSKNVFINNDRATSPPRYRRTVSLCHGIRGRLCEHLPASAALPGTYPRRDEDFACGLQCYSQGSV